MTRAEAIRVLRDIERASGKGLDEAIARSRRLDREVKGTGASVGAGIGALAGALAGGSPWERILGGAIGGLIGGGAGYGLGSASGRSERKSLYDEAKKRKDKKIDDLLARLDESSSNAVKEETGDSHAGIQTSGTEYGTFVSGKGKYSGDDRLVLKRDAEGRPILSLLFAGINSSVEDGGKASAKSPFAARFYNKNRGKFSDVQANTVFDDPIVADAYIDKIVAKIMANRDKEGRYPKIRVVGYSAGGRGVVNFLKKMRERDPNFRADEIVGIDPYVRPWEDIPESLRDPSNPVARNIVYSRLADNYTGSAQKGIGRIGDAISNTFVSLLGKKLDGLSAETIVENKIPGISHTDADVMYGSALDVLSRLDAKKRKNKETEE